MRKHFFAQEIKKFFFAFFSDFFYFFSLKNIQCARTKVPLKIKKLYMHINGLITAKFSYHLSLFRRFLRIEKILFFPLFLIIF